MGECRFDKDGYCVTPDHATSGMAGPALGGIGKADLERRVVEMKHVIHIDTDRIHDLESRVASLEEEKVEWGKINKEYRTRLAQVEAREAVLREALEWCQKRFFSGRCPCCDETKGHLENCLGKLVEIALSLDAGRTKEVKRVDRDSIP